MSYVWKRHKFNFDEDDVIDVMFSGDWHYGHRECDVNELERYIDWVKAKDNRYFVGMGDYVENSSSSSRFGMMEQDINPRKQLKYVVSLIKPIKDKILLLLKGNHEDRTERSAQIDVMDYICDVLNLENIGYDAFLRIQFHRCKYHDIYVRHGDSVSQNPEYELKKELRNGNKSGVCDIIAIAHSHDLFKYPYDGLEQDRHGVRIREIMGIRTGSFLAGADYARKKGYHPRKIGSPIVRFSSEGFKVFLGIDKYERV